MNQGNATLLLVITNVALLLLSCRKALEHLDENYEETARSCSFEEAASPCGKASLAQPSRPRQARPFRSPSPRAALTGCALEMGSPPGGDAVAGRSIRQ